ncbi:NAD(P)-binding protein, partial [Metschnikowia bicuspidata]
RNEEKVLKAIDEIKEEALARVNAYSEFEKQSRHLGTLQFINIDCSDLKSVERCCSDFLSKESKLHLLVNNAGLMAVPFEMTKDNYEIQYLVNFVAPFLFTLRLLPALKAAKEDTVPRVVNLTSVGHFAVPKYNDPSNSLNMFPLVIYTWVRYGNAKSALIQFTKKLAQEYSGIFAFAVHPGVITDTCLYNWWDSLPYIGRIFVLAKNVAGYFMGVSPEEGCLATLRAAMDQCLGESDNGAYLVTGGQISTPSSIALNQENIETTWHKTIEMLKERDIILSL